MLFMPTHFVLVLVCFQLAGKAATFCQPRSIISKSGILLAFANSYDRSISMSSVEFLQCALLAGQYRYTARVIGDDWPLPGKGTPAELVLRYFYLRGMVHIGCDDFQLAIRCFWTVLSVPSDAVSAIAVDAWKKMVLAKCLLLQDSVPYQTLVAAPGGASNSVSRFLASTTSPESTSSETNSVGISVYLELAKASHAGARQDVAKVRNDNSELWEADCNMGLVERLASDLEHRRVLQLASVYNILPLSQLAAELGTSEQNAYSTLNQVAGLKFRHDNGMIWFEVGSECPMTTEDALSLMKLAETIRKLDVSVAKSSRYQNIKVESGRPPRGVDDF